MLNRFSNYFIKRASWKVILFFVIVFILFNVLLFPYVMNRFGLQGQPMLDFLFGFTPDQAYSMISGYGEEGRAGVLWISGLVDMLYPFVFGGLLVFLISQLSLEVLAENSKWRTLNLVPIIAIFGDYHENLGIIIMTSLYPKRLDQFAVLSSVSGMIKWMFVAISIVVAFVLLFQKISRNSSKKKYN